MCRTPNYGTNSSVEQSPCFNAFVVAGTGTALHFKLTVAGQSAISADTINYPVLVPSKQFCLLCLLVCLLTTRSCHAAVTSVQGCNSSGPGAVDTVLCDTEGSQFITVTGNTFSGPQVLVNGTHYLLLGRAAAGWISYELCCLCLCAGLACSPIRVSSATTVECQLPPGGGKGQSVVVVSAAQFSQPKPFVSYAPPLITT